MKRFYPHRHQWYVASTTLKNWLGYTWLFGNLRCYHCKAYKGKFL